MADIRYVVIDYSDEDYLEVGSDVGYFEFEYVAAGYVASVVNGAATLTSAFSQTSTPYAFTKATASLASAFSQTSTGIRAKITTADLVSTATLDSTGVKCRIGNFSETNTFSLTATALQLIPAELTAFNSISLTVTAVKVFGASVAVNSDTTIAATALKIQPGVANFTAFNTVVSAAGRIRPAVDITALAATLTASPTKVFGAQVYNDRLDVGASNFPKDGKIANNPATYYHTLGNPSPYGNISPEGYTISGVNGSNQTSDITTGAFASNDAAYGTYFDGSHMLYDEPTQNYVANNKNIITFWYKKSIDLFGGTILSSAWAGEPTIDRVADSSLAISNNGLQIRTSVGPLPGVPNSSQSQSFDFTLPESAKNYDWHHYLLKIVDFSDIELFIDGVSQGRIIQTPPGVGFWALVGRFYVGVRRPFPNNTPLTAALKGVVKNLLIGGYTSFNINNYYGLGIQSEFTFTATGFKLIFGQASLTSAFSIVGVLGKLQPSSIAVDSASTLSATAYDFTKAAATLNTEAILSADAYDFTKASAALSAEFSLTPDADEISTGVSLVLATATIAVTASMIRRTSVTMLSTVECSGDATTNQLGRCQITSTATLSATPYNFTKGIVSASAVLTIEATARIFSPPRGTLLSGMQATLVATPLKLRIQTSLLQSSASFVVATGGALRRGSITMSAFDTVLSAGKVIEFLAENTIAVTEEQRLLRVALESTVLLVQMANGVNTITAETTDIVVPQEQGRLLAQYNLPTN